MKKIAILGTAHIHAKKFLQTLKQRNDLNVIALWDHDSNRRERDANILETRAISNYKEINTVYKINTKNVIEPHALGCMEFANAVFNDIKVPVPAEHSYQVMQILNAIYESQKLGKEILL